MSRVLGFSRNKFPTTYTRSRLYMNLSTSPISKSADGVYTVSKMPEPLPYPLKNSYYLLRHGQSWGNVEGVISSSRSLATSEKHGLTPLGVEQATESSQSLLKLILKEEMKPYRVYFYTSPFARARQTAQACRQGLSENVTRESVECIIHNEIIIHDGLMERWVEQSFRKHWTFDLSNACSPSYSWCVRYFGRLDNQAIHTYAYVWPVDMYDVTHTAFDVESVAAVATRLRETILSIDNHPMHTGDIIVLTSHADVLQILQLYAAGKWHKKKMGLRIIHCWNWLNEDHSLMFTLIMNGLGGYLLKFTIIGSIGADNTGVFSSYRFANGEVRKMGRSVDTLPKPQPLSPPKIGTWGYPCGGIWKYIIM